MYEQKKSVLSKDYKLYQEKTSILQIYVKLALDQLPANQ